MVAWLWLFLLLMVAVALLIMGYPFKRDKKSRVFLGVTIFIVPVVIYVCADRLIPIEQYLQKRQEAQVVARVLKQLQHPEEVIAFLQDYIQHHPQAAKPRYLLGKLYLGLGDDRHAYEMLKTAHQLQPDNKRYALAYWQIKQKMMARAVPSSTPLRVTTEPLTK